MIEVLKVQNIEDKISAFSKFDPRSEVWVVADLKSKMELQNRLLMTQGVVTGDSITRVSELWEGFLLKVQPQRQIVSRELLISYIGDLLSEVDLSWVSTPGAPEAVFNFAQHFLPVLSRSDGKDLLNDWLEQNSQVYKKWSKWLELSIVIWSQLDQLGWLAHSWAPGYLLDQDLSSLEFPRKYIFDLGVQVRPIELELINEISKNTNVTVLIPNPEWSFIYSNLLKTYWSFPPLNFESPNDVKNLSNYKPNGTFYKFPTMLAEIKDCVSQIREWLEQGVKSKEVAVIAPDIGMYWPTLYSYLKTEGVTASRGLKYPAHTHPSVNSWLSKIRILGMDISNHDLEQSLFFVKDQNPIIQYDEFKKYFTFLDEKSDLHRSKKVIKKYEGEALLAGNLDRTQFIFNVMRIWEDRPNSVLDSVLTKYFEETPLNLKMSHNQWLAYLEKLVSEIDYKVEVGDDNGIQCMDIVSAEYSNVSHVYCMGMSEDYLRISSTSMIQESDIELFSKDTGISLESLESNSTSFDLSWFNDKKDLKFVGSYPATSFEGDPLSPALIWLLAKSSNNHERMDTPRLTRWDEIQKSPLIEIEQLKMEEQKGCQLRTQSVQEDIGEHPIENIRSFNIKHLSASSIETYLKCPFKFAAEKVFRLNDISRVDFNSDPRDEGSLIHEILEELIGEIFQMPTQEKVKEVIRKLALKNGFENSDPQFKQLNLVTIEKLILRVLKFEEDWRKQHPTVSVVGREIVVDGYIDASDGKLSKYNSDSAIPFKGKIDRIEKDEDENYLIVDYKRSNSGLTNSGSWIKNNSLQMPIYMMAAKNGLTQKGSLSVKGSMYYILRSTERNKGAVVKEVSETFGAIKPIQLEEEKLSLIFKETKEKIKLVTSQIIQGDIKPQPYDKKECLNCTWKTICRAHHLN